MQLIDLTLRRFGQLVVVGRHDPRRWNCVCDCGNQTTPTGFNLRHGYTVSCGCHSADITRSRSRTHGGARMPEYAVWSSMKARCANPNHKAFARYGGRGIEVCDRWQSFDNFIADMGEMPEGLSIERVNNNGNYEPANCVWATPREQSLNRSITVLIEFRGETLCLKDWARRLGINPVTLHARIRRYGWPVERALTQGVRSYVATYN